MDSTTAPFKQPLYLFSLPEQIKHTLEVAYTDAHGYPVLEVPVKSTIEEGSSVSGDEIRTGTLCSTCIITFSSFHEQREHARSDLHCYNIKRKSRGLDAVTEEEFERSIAEEKLDDSLSGSEASDTGSDSSSDHSKINTEDGKAQGKEWSLQKLSSKTLEEGNDASHHQRPSSNLYRAPLVWFKSSALHSDTLLGVYRAWFSSTDLEEPTRLTKSIQSRQYPGTDSVTPDPARKAPHVFLCMIGGGHFAGMIVELAPKVDRQVRGQGEQKVTVLAHKTFHRYTTRRKQGGAQAGNDSAKGAAHSAGSSLRRYNEAALTSDVRALLSQWRGMIQASELLFIRATGGTNKKTIFGPYDDQVLKQQDRRIRSFPFSTRRATQSELMRSFIELSRVRVMERDKVLVEDRKKQLNDHQPLKSSQYKAARNAIHPQDAELELNNLHTSQVESLIRRSKAPALLSYLTGNSLDPNFKFTPEDSHSHHHSPTPLHYASSLNSAAVVYVLLMKAGADPTIRNAEGRSPFQTSGDRTTRDVFRQARSELGEQAWDWDGASVSSPLTKAETLERSQRNSKIREEAEARSRDEAIAKLNLDEQQTGGGSASKTTRNSDRKNPIAMIGQSRTPQQKREEESRGMSDEMRKRLEREKRARAAEERIQSLKKE